MAIPVVLASVLAGCGGGGSKPASAPVATAARVAATVVAQFESATARRDFATVCERLLSAAERAQAGGSDCPRLMAARARGIVRPRIRIRRIELTAGGALVHVRTTAEGQAPTEDVIRLVRERGGLRIASLGEPTAAP
jgi:hypothetical protein